MDKLEKILWEFANVEDDILSRQLPENRDAGNMIKILGMLVRLQEIKQSREVMAKS
ncbi:hypothetical protein LCGC14_2716530 [marine sediment metagenome]|uniref:Uncharacterized protein n=1 Tax=marine sediment metagenome TaxID=412755 RepID=A0A0F8ZYZ8_9ZZZZ